MQGKENGLIALGVPVVDQKHEMQSNCQILFILFKISKFRKW